jgi:hypothetical protein
MTSPDGHVPCLHGDVTGHASQLTAEKGESGDGIVRLLDKGHDRTLTF